MTEQFNKPAPEVDAETIRNLLQRVPLGAAQTIVLTRGPQLVAFRGVLKQVEALDVAVNVANEWQESGQTQRLQFMRLPLSTTKNLLLIYPLRDEFRLVLVDKEDASLEPLRKLSNQLLSILEVAGIGR